MALGIFGWSEDQFWDSTPLGFFAAMDAYRMANDPEYRKGREFADFKKGLEG